MTSGADFFEKGEGVGGIWFQVDDLDRESVEARRLGVEFETDEPVTFAEGRVSVAPARSMCGITTGFVRREPVCHGARALSSLLASHRARGRSHGNRTAQTSAT